MKIKKIIILENIKSNELSLVFSKIVSKGLCCDKVWEISIFPSCTPIRGIFRKSLLNVNNKEVLTSPQRSSCLYINYFQSIVHDTYYKQASQEVMHVYILKSINGRWHPTLSYNNSNSCLLAAFPPQNNFASRYVRDTHVTLIANLKCRENTM